MSSLSSLTISFTKHHVVGVRRENLPSRSVNLFFFFFANSPFFSLKVFDKEYSYQYLLFKKRCKDTPTIIRFSK